MTGEPLHGLKDGYDIRTAQELLGHKRRQGQCVWSPRHSERICERRRHGLAFAPLPRKAIFARGRQEENPMR